MDLIRTPAVVIERPFEAAFRPVALTPKRADTVVAQTLWSAISTGTDMKSYRGEQHPEQCYYPLVPGYENMGVILEEGSYAPDLKAGDRVMINECRKYGDVCAAWGGGTRLVHKDSDNAGGAGDPMCKVPDNVSDTDAVLAYLACVPLKGLEKFDLRPTDTVVVVGAGMVGISAMQLLKIKCPGIRVIAIEKNGFRREIAQHYADVVLPHDDTTERKLLDLTGGKKADKIMECSGNPAVPGILHRYLKDGGWGDDDEPGHIHLQGDYPEKLLFDHYHRWFTKNCTITMSCAIKARGKAEILKYMAEGRFDTSHLPCEIWPVQKVKEAFEYQNRKGYDVFKILLDWREVK